MEDIKTLIEKNKNEQPMLVFHHNQKCRYIVTPKEEIIRIADHRSHNNYQCEMDSDKAYKKLLPYLGYPVMSIFFNDPNSIISHTILLNLESQPDNWIIIESDYRPKD